MHGVKQQTGGSTRPRCPGSGAVPCRIREMSDAKTAEFSDLLREDRRFDPPAGFRAAARVRDESIYAEAERDPEAFWAGFASELEWSTPVDADPGLATAAREVVRRRTSERQRELHRSARARSPPEQGRDHLGRRAGRQAHADLFRPVPRSVAVRQRPEIAGREEGRPRRAVPAAHPRARHRHAGVRANRRGAQRGVRRLQRRVAARPHQRRTGDRCWSPPTAVTGAARSCR